MDDQEKPDWALYAAASIGLHTLAIAGGLLLMVVGALLARWVAGTP